MAGLRRRWSLEYPGYPAGAVEWWGSPRAAGVRTAERRARPAGPGVGEVRAAAVEAFASPRSAARPTRGACAGSMARLTQVATELAASAPRQVGPGPVRWARPPLVVVPVVVAAVRADESDESAAVALPQGRSVEVPAASAGREEAGPAIVWADRTAVGGAQPAAKLGGRVGDAQRVEGAVAWAAAVGAAHPWAAGAVETLAAGVAGRRVGTPTGVRAAGRRE